MMAIAAERYAEAAGEAARPAGGAAEAAAPSAVGELEELGRRLVTARLEVGEAGEDGWRPFRLALRIAPGWHLNANPAADPALVPTSVAAEGARLRDVAYPAGGEPFYEGEVQSPAPSPPTRPPPASSSPTSPATSPAACRRCGWSSRSRA